MINLLNKYSRKLSDQGICDPGVPLLGGLDAELIWNKEDSHKEVLEDVFNNLNINSLLFSPAKDPYNSILEYLSENSSKDGNAIYPQDCETRTFLHDIPVIDEFKAEPIIQALKYRKGVIVKGHGIITFGTVSPEQAFVTYSSICFSCFVKIFKDCIESKNITSIEKQLIDNAINKYESFLKSVEIPEMKKGPFKSADEIIHAMDEAGKLTVSCRLVDSFFGNISYIWNNHIYISQTGSSLDELPGYVDACAIDGSSCSGVTASSELTAHREILCNSDQLAILHGHPKFSVILSMICDIENCEEKDNDICHLKCPYERFIDDIPVIPGEVGTGRYGLCNTLPKAVKDKPGAIVYGHGLFVTGKVDYHDAFKSMIRIERMCLKKVKDLIK